MNRFFFEIALLTFPYYMYYNELSKHEERIMSIAPKKPKFQRSDDAQKLIDMLRESPFNRDYRKVDLPVKNFFTSLAGYTHPDEPREAITPDRIFEAVPDFQRDNNKWSQAMQIKFVENVLKGFIPQITLFSIGKNTYHFQILDGLQRVTALHAFMTGEFKVFGYTFQELCDMRVISVCSCIAVRLYDFNTKNEAIQFYIDMNENITHSPQDIEKAKKYLV